MAKGLLGGILGDDKEKTEVEAPEALASAEAFAASVAARLSASDPEVARETSSFLRDQSHLLKVQAKHLEDEHALRIAHLRNQLREENVRSFGLRLRVGFQLYIALVATVIGVGAAVILHDAVTFRQVVVASRAMQPCATSVARQHQRGACANRDAYKPTHASGNYESIRGNELTGFLQL